MGEHLTDHLHQMDCIVCVAPQHRIKEAHEMAAAAPDVPRIDVLSDDSVLLYRLFGDCTPMYHMRWVLPNDIMATELMLVTATQGRACGCHLSR